MTIKDALAEKVWAVIGATHKTDKFGYKIYKCLKEHGYEVYPVNPNVTSIDGDTCYPSLSALPVVPGVVDFVVPETAGRFGLHSRLCISSIALGGNNERIKRVKNSRISRSS